MTSSYPAAPYIITSGNSSSLAPLSFPASRFHDSNVLVLWFILVAWKSFWCSRSHIHSPHSRKLKKREHCQGLIIKGVRPLFIIKEEWNNGYWVGTKGLCIPLHNLPNAGCYSVIPNAGLFLYFSHAAVLWNAWVSRFCVLPLRRRHLLLVRKVTTWLNRHWKKVSLYAEMWML